MTKYATIIRDVARQIIASAELAPYDQLNPEQQTTICELVRERLKAAGWSDLRRARVRQYLATHGTTEPKNGRPIEYQRCSACGQRLPHARISETS